jgi:hypothetical protein
MIRRAKEGEITWMQGLLASDMPRLPSGISLHIRRGELGIEAQGVVGVVPLLNGDTLQILPKIGQMNFLRLLFKAEGFQRDLEREYADFVSYSVEDEENIDSLVARQLMYAADYIMNRSPQQGRVKRRRESVFAAGQIDVVSTALNLASRKHEPVVYFVRERTCDIPENRVLSEAIVRAFHALNKTDRQELDWIRERWLRQFPRSENIDLDLEEIEEGFASERYGGPRDYYRRPLMLAQIVLGSSGLGFAESVIMEGDAILLNTADIFERYLRNVINEAYSEAGYVVTKGGVGATSLYTDGSFELLPDITISRDGRLKLIADAKYKEPTSGDHYQLHTYMSVNGIKRGLILAPLYEGNEVRLREYSTTDKMVVREAYIPMSNLAVTEEFLGTIVEKYS